ncbi:MAG: aminodeoxychorismate lyase [Steroidobacteraceae bacterium]
MLAAWVNGARAGSIGLADRGLHYGDGLFETIGASEGRARFLAAHLARLSHGCAALAIPVPAPEVLRLEIARAAQLAPRVLVKVIVTRGDAIERGYAYSGAETPTRIVCAYAWPEGPDGVRPPARAALAALRSGRPLLAGVKHLNRLEQVLARQEARQRGLDEVILAGDGHCIAGGSMTNVFALAAGRLVTPPVAHCAVAGVLRGQLLAAASHLGLATSEQPLKRADLVEAEALWLTNARVGVWPVATFEDRIYAAHEYTPLMQQAVHEAAHGRIDA